MSRGRDNQRSKVYHWQRVWARAEGIDRYSTDEAFAKLEACEAFLGPIWRAERGRVGLARAPAPTLARNLWGQRRATASDLNVIKLPMWARNKYVMLHELAHRLTPRDEAHGPRFVGVMIGLLARHAGMDATKGMRLADEVGVRYYSRSIGTVPARNLRDYVERRVVAGPATTMEIACDLSIGEGIPNVTERRVRGAVVSLIRSGKARYFRGKVQALDAAAPVR